MTTTTITSSSSSVPSSSSSDKSCLSFRTSVVAVGATPESILASVPGASKYAQPFYTQENAQETRALLEALELQVTKGHTPRIAIIGGGYAGVELAASVKRRIPKSAVSLLTRGPPMKGTRAEDLVNKALKRLGVQTEVCSVESLAAADTSNSRKMKSTTPVIVKRSAVGSESSE
jgi:NADH dehydrogenase FAD-containing subunit